MPPFAPQLHHSGKRSNCCLHLILQGSMRFNNSCSLSDAKNFKVCQGWNVQMWVWPRDHIWNDYSSTMLTSQALNSILERSPTPSLARVCGEEEVAKLALARAELYTAMAATCTTIPQQTILRSDHTNVSLQMRYHWGQN